MYGRDNHGKVVFLAIGLLSREDTSKHGMFKETLMIRILFLFFFLLQSLTDFKDMVKAEKGESSRYTGKVVEFSRFYATNVPSRLKVATQLIPKIKEVRLE